MEQLKKTLQAIGDNLEFILVIAAIAIGLYVLARLSERFLLPEKRKITPARRVSIVGIYAALAAILHILDFPLLFIAPEFYKLDFSEIPVLLCGFYLGPSATVACEGIKILLKLLFKGTSTAFVGDFANFAVGCSFVLPAVIIYHIHKTRKNAIIGLSTGTAILTVFGSAFNAIYLLPTFAKMFIPMEAILAAGSAVNSNVNSITTFVAFCVAPLNLLKGVTVSILTMLLYKRTAKLITPRSR